MLVADIGEHHGELVSAETGEGVAVADMDSQPPGHGVQQLVAEGVAEGVVDRLETVQVQIQHRHQPLIVLRRRQRLFQAFLQQQAVGQFGERVVIGETVDVCIGQFLLGEVGEHAQVIDGLALFVADGNDGQPFRVSLGILAPVPDFALPVAELDERGPHGLVKSGIVPIRAQQPGGLADGLRFAVTGDGGERAVHLQDVGLGVGNDDAFGAVLEHLAGKSQFFRVLLQFFLGALQLVVFFFPVRQCAAPAALRVPGPG